MSHSHVVKHGKPGARQTHMNREKFNPYRHKDENQRLHQSILDTMTSLCCKRCCDIIQWKVDFGKYQSLDRPRRCNGCHERNVAIAYHHICQECAKTAICCAKCQRPPPTFTESGLEVERDDASNSDAGSNHSDDDSVQRKEAERTAVSGHNTTSKDHLDAMLKYVFVNNLDSDEEFQPYRGLDYRRLKQYKKRITAMREKEERGQLRERDRRTVLRKLKKERDGPDQGDDVTFSDEEII